MTTSSIQRLDKNVVAQEIDLLDGHLLGDGSVFKSGKDRIHCIYSHRCKEKEYLDWLVVNTNFLSSQRVTEVSIFDKRTQKTYKAYHLKSKSNEVFTLARQRWYPNGKKVLAPDIIITSRMLLRFYINDGSYCRGGVYIATNDFSRADVEILAYKISSFSNLDISIHKAGDEKGEAYKLYIKVKDCQNFLDIIGKCPVKCYEYKWGE